ncbi:DUF421 domain-containing protein [Ohtaekwangia sp.]|uniref:DUF421 domain-containing protein n=1 Tax=Ohtaekwangia sp. TaxID=2066019 RepID=UPI002F93BB11
MKKEDIEAWDWKRILFGQAPEAFLIEVFARTLIIYILLTITLRMLGKRMDGQLTLIELAVMITIGAVVSVPMQMPDRGILVGVVALTIILIFQRGLNWLTIKNSKIENLTQGTLSILVKNGVMQLDEMKSSGISKQHLFSALREKNILNLGKVNRVYFEACGLLNIYLLKEDRVGLSLLPSHEMKFMLQQTHTEKSKVACKNCGYVTDAMQRSIPCANCHKTDWIEAIH